MKTAATARNVELVKRWGKTEGDANCRKEGKTLQAVERRENCGVGAVLKNLNNKKKKKNQSYSYKLTK